MILHSDATFFTQKIQITTVLLRAIGETRLPFVIFFKRFSCLAFCNWCRLWKCWRWHKPIIRRKKHKGFSSEFTQATYTISWEEASYNHHISERNHSYFHTKRCSISYSIEYLPNPFTRENQAQTSLVLWLDYCRYNFFISILKDTIN